MTEKLLPPRDSVLSEITAQEAEVLKEVLHAIREIRYGQIQITLQDSKVVQIDQTEKHRLDRK